MSGRINTVMQNVSATSIILFAIFNLLRAIVAMTFFVKFATANNLAAGAALGEPVAVVGSAAIRVAMPCVHARDDVHFAASFSSFWISL